MTNLALQKLVYFCHAWFLVDLKRPLIRHKFEAWEYGPVLPYLYREFKAFDRSPITSRATQIDPHNGKKKVVPYSFDAETQSQLSKVVGFYSHMRAGDLVELSHVADGPWHRVWFHGGKSNPGMQIDNSSIAEFYAKAHYSGSIQ
ncbi:MULTISPECIES: Panacea domain-containing protein [Methylobacterium]|uniref:DUF4065 domain-containing protein n=1 Tax=Methylobacterium ajmalii TaxID=2738439 RepID=A0ABU9ZW17_9HYPH|nr:type II toxin-antitoxin system antitoxin SocA domain-containing protein [Methylobacterium aquaticum]